MFDISIAGFNTGGGNVNFKGFSNHVYRLPHGQYGYHGHVTNLLQDANSSFTFIILAKARPTMPCICLVSLIIIPSLEHKVRMIIMHKCESGGPAKRKSSK